MGCKCIMILWVLFAKYFIILYCGERSLLATDRCWGGLQTMLLLTHAGAQLSRMSNRSSGHPAAAVTGLVPVLSQRMLMWYTHFNICPLAQPCRFGTTGTLPVAWDSKNLEKPLPGTSGNSWWGWWILPCGIPLPLLRTCSCCQCKYMLEFTNEPGSFG